MKLISYAVLGGIFFFFFQAEDGIRDYKVTGVQTCALPIWPRRWGRSRGWPKGGGRVWGQRRIDNPDNRAPPAARGGTFALRPVDQSCREIGRASCRERV